jgi:drug/metabolite transporter (DMT)-like permease
MYIALIVFAQFLYSLSDVWKKVAMAGKPFDLALFGNVGFLAANLLPIIPHLFFVYALSRYPLSRATITLGVSAVFFSSLFGWYFFKEQISGLNMVGYSFAVLAIVMINWK